jgi:very-short-patch-repair endonuclease
MKPTLTLRPADERADAPRVPKKGRGWNVTSSRLDAIHETAREMRRNPSVAHAALALELGKADLGKYKFKGFAVIGSAIADFACQPLKLVVMLSEGVTVPEVEQRRDKSLTEVGLRVIRYDAAEVAADPEGAAQAVLGEMKHRFNELRAAPRAYGARPNGARPQASRPYGRDR